MSVDLWDGYGGCGKQGVMNYARTWQRELSVVQWEQGVMNYARTWSSASNIVDEKRFYRLTFNSRCHVRA